jgi:hypothetical protein
MTSNAPVQGSGFVHRLAAIWADINHAQKRIVELQHRPMQSNVVR